MSKRDVRLYLTDILDCIDRVERYTTGLSYKGFIKNGMVIDAVLLDWKLKPAGRIVKKIPRY